MAYDEGDVQWSRWYVGLWIVNVIALALLAPFVAERTWVAAFGMLFLLPELVALRAHRDKLPPLTYVTRRYVPRWIPTALTFAFGAFLICTWFGVTGVRTLEAVGVAGMVGWLTNHWDVTYS